MRRWRGVGVGFVVLVALSAAIGVAVAQPRSCPTVRGGTPGGMALLRYVDVHDDHAIFTFGLANGGNFRLPEYTVTQDGDTAWIHFTGASGANVDGTSAYGDTTVIYPHGAIVTAVRLESDAGREVEWSVQLTRGACASVVDKQYTEGTFSRAQVIVTFGNLAALTIEPNPAYLGGVSVWASGSGFAPSTTVSIEAQPGAWKETATDERGTFHVGFSINGLASGSYVVRAVDSVGHYAEAPLTIPVRTYPYAP